MASSISISWCGVVAGLEGELHQPAGVGIHGGLAQLRRVHLAQPLEALDVDLALDLLGGDAVEHALFLGVVEGVEHLLADIDAVQRRHGDVDMAGVDQTAEVAQEQRAQQRRDMRAVGVGVGEDADLAVTQPLKIIRAGVDADGDGDVMHLLRGQHLGGIDFPGVQDLAAQRHDRLEFAVARLLGGTAGGIALDQKQLGARRIARELQSASLPGSAGPW